MLCLHVGPPSVLQQFAALNSSFYIRELHQSDFSRAGLLARRGRSRLGRRMFVLTWEDMGSSLWYNLQVLDKSFNCATAQLPACAGGKVPACNST